MSFENFPHQQVTPTEQPETKIEQETNNDPTTETELVQALAQGGDVSFLYNEHYGVDLTFHEDGTTSVTDGKYEDFKEYTLNYGDSDSSVAKFVNRIRMASNQFKASLAHIPSGNLERDFGGAEGLAQAFLRTELAKEYTQNSPE